MYRINKYQFDTFKCQAELHKSNYAVLSNEPDKGIKYAPYANFSDEYNMLKALSHSQIPRTYDIGQGDLYKDSKFLIKQNFIVLQHIKGYDVVEYFKEKDVENIKIIDEIIHLFISLCGPLQYLHDNNYIHCDLKPGHLIIEQKTGVLCLIDFELAISREEAIKGISREYASPEQFRMLDYLKTIPEDANLKNIPANILLDGKTDLYSAGLILYQLLTKNVWQTNKVLPGKINRHIPKKVEEIIINLLKDTPSERISSAEELKKHLLNSMI